MDESTDGHLLLMLHFIVRLLLLTQMIQRLR